MAKKTRKRADGTYEEYEEADFNLFNPSSWFSGIGGGISGIFGMFGSVFSFLPMLLILVPGVYFLAHSETVQNLIGGLLGEDGAQKVKGFVAEMDAGLSAFLPGIFGTDGLDKLVDGMSAEDARKKLPEKEVVPQFIADVIAKDPETWTAVRKVLKTNNGGHYSKDMMSNPDVIVALITDPTTKPLMREVLAAAKPKPGEKPTPEQIAATAKFMEPLKKFIASPGLDKLLANDAMRADVLGTLISSMGINLNPSEISDFIKKVGLDAEGKVTRALRKFLTDAMTPDDKGNYGPAVLKALAEFKQSDTGAAHAQEIDLLTGKLAIAATQALVTQITPPATGASPPATNGQPPKSPSTVTPAPLPADLGDLQDTETKKQALGALITSKNGPALAAFLSRSDWSSADLKAAIPLIEDSKAALDEYRKTMETQPLKPTTRASIRMMTNPAMIDVVNAFINAGPADSTSLTRMKPDEMMNAVMQAIYKSPDLRNYMRNPQGATEISKLVQEVATVFFAADKKALKQVTPQNITLLTNFIDKIAGNGANHDGNEPRTQQLLQAVSRVVSGDTNALFALPNETLAGFLADRTNNNAVRDLLRQLPVDAITDPNAKVLMRALKENWDVSKPGIARLLTNPEGVVFIKKFLHGDFNEGRSKFGKLDTIAAGFYAQQHGIGEDVSKLTVLSNVGVMKGLSEMLRHKNTGAFTNLNPEDIAKFFADPANRRDALALAATVNNEVAKDMPAMVNLLADKDIAAYIIKPTPNPAEDFLLKKMNPLAAQNWNTIKDFDIDIQNLPLAATPAAPRR